MALLFVFAGLAGCFWSLGSNVHAIVTHFIAPPLFGAAVAIEGRGPTLWRQSALLVALLLVAECVRLIAYCLLANGWRYITADGETQLWLAASFALQSGVGLAAWAVARLAVKPRQPPQV